MSISDPVIYTSPLPQPGEPVEHDDWDAFGARVEKTVHVFIADPELGDRSMCRCANEDNARHIIHALNLARYSDRIFVQDRIGLWHVATFGPNSQEVGARLADKWNEEVREFNQARTANDQDQVDRESADLVILLLARAHRRGFDLMGEVERKFAEVRSRDQRARDLARGIRWPQVEPISNGSTVDAPKEERA